MTIFVRWCVILTTLWGAAASGQQRGPLEDYREIAAAIESAIQYEIADKDLRAISIAVVDDQQLVWAQGFGKADPAQGVAATADTVYRVGSVSKLFTDVGVMQLVERGELDLDAPLQTYLPDFHPHNPFEDPITLRQLMAHRGGLVREPPVGNYFDASAPSLAATVASLNETTLVHRPGSRSKYSNAGIAVVGYVLERTQGRPFAAYLKSSVLEPIGMTISHFEPTPAIAERLADAEMWSYDGRTFPAPPIQLGMAPAGSMYSTVSELCQFMSVIFNDGQGPAGRVLQAETLQTMLAPQFAPPEATTGYGIGFRIGELDGRITHGHGGAMYGFSTQLQFVKDEKIGVVVVSATDVTNTLTRRLANHTLRLELAARAGRPLPEYVRSEPIDPLLARALDGGYQTADQHPALEQRNSVHLVERNGALFAFLGTDRVRLRRGRDGLIVDDRGGYGTVLEVLPGGDLRIDGTTYVRQPAVKPPPVPDRWRGLIGEYGWDHQILFVFEMGGQLHLLIEWIEIDRLEELGEDRFAFSKQLGMYHGEEVQFVRDASGRATAAIVAGIAFPRRSVAGEGTRTFTINPLGPVDRLREIAMAAEPPPQRGEFRDSDLVDLASLDATLKFDIRYASANNFMQVPFYTMPKALLQRPAAEALVRAHRSLRRHGVGLLIHDTYRPWHVTKMFWDATPESMKRFVANAAEGSRHNRGCAADVSLFDLATGEPVEMTGQYDEFTERSYPDYVGGTSQQRWYRELLRDAMEAQGFSVYEYEWWHFDYRDWRHYRIENRTFEEILGSPP